LNAILKSFLARLRPGAAAPLIPPGFLKGLLPVAILAVGITALVMMFMWRDQASYKPLFGASEKVSAADMMTVLDAAGIGYRLHPDTGQVLVPGDRLGEVRMLLASKGVTAKLPAGLELMDSKDPLGTSQFVQDVRFRRGLEGELAQSIMTIDSIAAARVHLSIARSSSFVVSSGEKSSASVVLSLKPGRELQDEQIAAIVNMVANSASGLDPTRVTLVDQAGNYLSSRVDLTEGYEAGHGNDAARYYQDQTRKNVHDLLAPVLGGENFKVSITADVDNDRIKETHEEYGNTPKITNESVREEMDRDPLALGVPGSLSNRPVAVAADTTEGKASSAQKNASTRAYAYDRTITQIQRSRGRLRKLNVAVVLNAAAAPAGSAVWNDAQIADIDRILRSGLGIDTTRGDTLVVSTLAFPSQPAALPWWQERENIVDYGSTLLYALAGLLAFLFVVRPAMKVAQARLALPAPALVPVEASVVSTDAGSEAGTEAAALASASKSKAAISVSPLLQDFDLPPPGSPVDVMVDHLKVLAAKEPERVAEVVKQWVQKNDRSE
jgi:flagellar M-ring protein FliF